MRNISKILLAAGLLVVVVLLINTNKPKVNPNIATASLGLPSSTFNPLESNARELNKDEYLLALIMRKLRREHYLAPSLNDDFSNKVFDLYLKEIDYNKKFLTEADIKQLRIYRNMIDQLLMAGSLEFFDLSHKIISNRISSVDDMVNDILSKPFSFDKKESIEFDVDKLSYVKNDKAQKNEWKKLLKYRVLQAIYTKQKQQEKLAEDGKGEKSFTELEKEARKEVLESQQETFKRLNNLERKDWLSIYLNSVTAVYDPHTNYMPPADKANFDISMSGRLQGIGARLSDKDGYVTVASIVPGSPCWKQGDLAVGDKILKVGQAEDEPKNVVGMRTDQAVSLIRGKKNTEVRLTVEHMDGTTQMISIIRDIIELEETYAKKAIVNNVGYIYLPRFYADFNGTGGPGCSKDVENAIKELKEQNVEGIVLDLRNNGGGSLAEVVDMTGLFIEDGPIVQVKVKGRQAQDLRDRDRRIQYDGPLVVMVNSFSASASEILAAAIQDYERGIILGLTPSTYGKGTVQRAADLDREVDPKQNYLKPFGALKLTTQKFYRIDGGATQLKGVIPDIVLPSSRSYLKIGEKEQSYAIPWDKISSLDFEKWDSLKGKKETVIKASNERIASNAIFQKIEEFAKRTKKLNDESEYSLKFDEYKNMMEMNEKESKEYSKLLKNVDSTSVSLAAKDAMKYENDTLYQEKVDRWFSSLKKDIYVNEAVKIIGDLQ